MNIRAVIFDVYGTLLEVGPPPPDAPENWDRLWRETLGKPARLSIQEFAGACDGVIAREHASARSVGVAYPEVYWPKVVVEVIPELAGQRDGVADEFMNRQAGLWHSVRLMPGAAEVLSELRDSERGLGIASNSQPYTLRELDQALANHGLSREIFSPPLCFWSFEAGFAKPDPHVFRWLTARLRHTGMEPGEAMMVGDRADNDIAPARAQGWQTWHLSTTPTETDGLGGDWEAFGEYLGASTRKEIHEPNHA